MPLATIAEVFSERIDRPIEEVIKVDALDDQLLVEEIKEYYPTPSIQEQMAEVLEAYSNVRMGPTEKVGVWVSGFFGAGKSSFAKLLGVLLESRKIGAQDAVDLFSRRVTSDRIKVLLHQIRERLPTHVVIFDILKDSIAGAREHPVTTVMYRALLRSLGYPLDLDLAELEITLEQRGVLDAFRERYAHLYPGRTWDEAKRLPMVAHNEASNVLHSLDKGTYPAPDSWARTRPRADISPRKLAERVLQLAEARAGGRNVVFVVDEIGQYSAKELSRILDLQGIVESFSIYGRGKIWLVATSQEKLEAIVDIWERAQSDLVRLQDRFGYKVFLSPRDIREVASHRVLSKSAEADAVLRDLYQRHRGRLSGATQVKGVVELPGLEEDAFVRLYPLLPYQVDLLISVVSGLRRQGGAAQTMGGANRTIIKLAQQLLIHEQVGLAHRPVGHLVTFDSVYDLLRSNISTEIQQEIDEIDRLVPHPFAGRVARALALLQFAEVAYTTEENLAAVLHPSVDGEGVLGEVREAVSRLIDARKVRRTEHGLKIQSAAERTWDQERDSRRPTEGDRRRLIKAALEQLWGSGAAQQPSHQLGGWKRFTAGLRVGTERLVDGDVTFEVRLLDPGRATDAQIQEARAATQQDTELVTWVVEVSSDAEGAVVEQHRSERMLQRGARTRDEEALLRDEKRRLDTAQRSLREELARALCRGHIFFQGNDRSPGEEADDPKAEARRVLGSALQQIFHRFGDGDVKVGHADVDAILRTEGLAGLPDSYTELGLVQTVDGQTRLVTDQGASREVLDWVRSRCEEGQAPSGRELEQHFRRPPYGWGFELVQLLVATLLRAGLITLRSQGQQHRSATAEARREITNNTRFRALTVSVRESTLDPRRLREAGRALEQRFGHRCPALTAQSVAGVLRERLCAEAPRIERAVDGLRDLGLPGREPLAQGIDALRAIERGDDEEAVLSFVETADTLAKALPRARAIDEGLTEPVRRDLAQAQAVLAQVGPLLERELAPADPARQAVVRLADALAKETFYEHLAEIRSSTQTLLAAYQALYDSAFEARRAAYRQAIETLEGTPGWAEIEPGAQEDIARRLRLRADEPPEAEAWRQAGSALTILREQADAAAKLMEDALGALRRALTPQAVEIPVRTLLNGAIASPEELEAALAAIREAVERALADGHPVVLI